MSQTEQDLSEGKLVIEFEEPNHRRDFFRTAAKMGMGGALVVAGVACNTEDTPSAGNGATASPTAATQSPDEGPQVPASDIDILNFALTLEALEADFYERGINQKVVSGRELQIVEVIGAHEAAHAEVLTQTILDLGGEPVTAPEFKYPDGTFNDRKTFLETASTFEELGVTAYYGQVTNIKTPDLLAAAASIAGVESRHAAVIARLIGGEPFPGQIEETKSMDAVLKAAEPFIES
ncbi:MAG: ferritin-like domain-containing protein [Actinomycetota bacterium]